MIVNSSRINSTYAVYFSASSSPRNIDKISGSRSQSDEKSFLKNTSEDHKNKIISEGAGKDPSPREYNSRLSRNAPASKPLKSTRSFNETKKSAPVSEDEPGDIIELEETDDYEKVRNSTGGSYYIVIDEKNREAQSGIKTSKDLWKERITKIYNTGIRKESGVLVNLFA